jgi:hypothetical protein
MPGDVDSFGYGFGVSVFTRRDNVAGAVGTFRLGRRSRHLVVFGPTGGHDHHPDDAGRLGIPRPPNVCLDFWTSAYQAIDD